LAIRDIGYRIIDSVDPHAMLIRYKTEVVAVLVKKAQKNERSHLTSCYRYSNGSNPVD